MHNFQFSELNNCPRAVNCSRFYEFQAGCGLAWLNWAQAASQWQAHSSA